MSPQGIFAFEMQSCPFGCFLGCPLGWPTDFSNWVGPRCNSWLFFFFKSFCSCPHLRKWWCHFFISSNQNLKSRYMLFLPLFYLLPGHQQACWLYFQNTFSPVDNRSNFEKFIHIPFPAPFTHILASLKLPCFLKSPLARQQSRRSCPSPYVRIRTSRSAVNVWEEKSQGDGEVFF